MNRQRIYSVKNNALNDADRLALATMLVKAGYTVRIGKEPVPNGKSSRYYVEFWEEGA